MDKKSLFAGVLTGAALLWGGQELTASFSRTSTINIAVKGPWTDQSSWIINNCLDEFLRSVKGDARKWEIKGTVEPDRGSLSMSKDNRTCEAKPSGFVPAQIQFNRE